MELQRALDKPKMGMNKTPIICLVHQSCLEKLSNMVKGVDREKEDVVFVVAVYKNVGEAKSKITDFLRRKLK